MPLDYRKLVINKSSSRSPRQWFRGKIILTLILERHGKNKLHIHMYIFAISREIAECEGEVAVVVNFIKDVKYPRRLA